MEQNKQLQLVTFEQAKKLKELGFDWETKNLYSCGGEGFDIPAHSPDWKRELNNGDVILAPSVALALKWFRDVKGYLCYTSFHYVKQKIKYAFFILLPDNTVSTSSKYFFNTQEAAESALLDKLLELAERKNVG